MNGDLRPVRSKFPWMVISLAEPSLSATYELRSPCRPLCEFSNFLFHVNGV